MPKTNKKNASSNSGQKWTPELMTLKELLEEELHGLLHYLRSLHTTAIVLLSATTAIQLFSITYLFSADHRAVVAFLVVISTSILVSIMAGWTLKPWTLPRFLLPIDMNNFSIDELKQLTDHPFEYIKLLKTHTQILSEQYLRPKLNRLRNAVGLLIFGFVIAIIITITLP